MRHILISLLILMIMFGSFGYLYSAQEDFYSKASSKYKGTVLSLMCLSGVQNRAILKLADEFQKISGIKVNVVSTPYEPIPRGSTTMVAPLENLSLHDKIAKDFEKKTAKYDVILVDSLWIEEFSKNLVDLNTLFKKKEISDPKFNINDFHPTLLNSCKKGNSLYGIPFLGDAMVIFYREDLFKKGGVSFPKTWAEFNKIVSSLTKKPTYGISFPGAKKAELTNLFLDRYSSHLIKEDKASFNDENGIKALDMLKELIKYAQPNALEEDIQMAMERFRNGEAAIFEGWISYYPDITDMFMSQVKDKVKIALVPGGKPVIGGWVAGINSDSKNKEASFLLIQYLTNANGETKRAISLNFPTVARISTFKNKDVAKNLPFIEIIKTSLDKGITRPFLPDFYLSLNNILSEAIWSALKGEDSKSALDRAASKWDDILKKGRR